MRVLVAGSQLWADKTFVFEELDWLLEEMAANEYEDYIFTLVHGHCPNGADAFADEWGELRKSQGFPIVIERHPADWKGPRKRGAGYARNAEMVKLGADRCRVFILDDSPGSTHLAGLAEKADIPTVVERRSTMNLPVKRVEEELTLRNIRMIYKNFSGKPGTYNAEGQRNFSVELDHELAAEIRQIGWNPKLIKRTAEFPEEDRLYHLKVNVSYDNRPPRIFFITKSTNSRNPIDEEFVGLVDRGIFDKVDVTLSPYNHKMNGGGVTAYLRTMYCVLHEDPLDQEYAWATLPGEEEPHLAIENSRGGPLELESGNDDEGIIIVEDSGWSEEDDNEAA